jgi:hypothetical protein
MSYKEQAEQDRNVLQVAIDHMIDHLKDLIISPDTADFYWDDFEEELEKLKSRLQSALRLKAFYHS